VAAFYLDHDVPNDLAAFLQAAGHSAVTVRNLGTRRDKDSQHLLAAARSGRILITHNRDDYVLLQDAWVRWSVAWSVNPSHAGILIIPQMSARRMSAEIVSLVDSGPVLTNALYVWDRTAGWVRST
jgi:predicted nuclease of predicted toxin-antitoxin system